MAGTQGDTLRVNLRSSPKVKSLTFTSYKSRCPFNLFGPNQFRLFH